MRFLAFVLVPAGLAFALVAACGGSGTSTPEPGPMDCAWTASETNCWKTTIAVVKDCLPPDSETGVLSADGKTCTFQGAKVVTFDTPLTIPPPDLLSFTIKSGETACVTKTETATDKKLTSSAGTFEEQINGLAMTVICPDGSKFATPNALLLTRCGDAGMSFDGMPGDLTSWSGNVVSYSLLGGPQGAPIKLFTCQQQ